MRLASLAEYRRLVFTPDSAPHMKTLRAQIGKIPGGQKRGGRYYVDLDELDKETHFVSDLQKKVDQHRKNPLLRGLL